ncbi:MAG: MerR family DNA-binding protein [Sphingomonadales bacterium]|nr:MerR family DNA-binding protein [Sphingomonadales bacterium]MDE2170426.1 MerR family DNA-binding protein [Sphingomonadales bacterium]
MADMTIARLAQAAGVGVETVRYYQRRGLMPQPARPMNGGSGGGVRRYDQGDARRLRFIRSAQAAGFTLEEISRLLEFDAVGDRAQVRSLARQRVMALEVKIAELTMARDALTGLANACEGSGPGACPILLAFEEN